MGCKTTYRLLVLSVATVMVTVSATKAEAVSFASGDGTPCNPAGLFSECVTVNPLTTIQPGHPSSAPNVTVLDGSGGGFTFPSNGWYDPATQNIPGKSQTLNEFTGLSANWVSYTDSGVLADGVTAPNPPAVPNYCGTSGPLMNGGTVTVGGNTATGPASNPNPNGNPLCNFFDASGNQSRTTPDSGRVIGNQNATFTEKVTVGPGSWSLELYSFYDDVAAVEVLGPGGTHITLNTANPFPASTTYNAGGICVEPNGKFTASGLDPGTYTFNFYAFQVASCSFGVLYGGVFNQVAGPVIPEPSSVLLLGTGLGILELIRRRKKVPVVG